MHNHQNFSSCKRNALIDELGKKKFDLLIIGGGITGAGVAIDAVSRGLSVALIEKMDFASGTSSRSTKLIHGGLRYLQNLQIPFVAQLGRERKIIRRNAQNNVIPTPVLLPIYKKGKFSKITIWLALFIYDYIAGVRKKYRASWISPKVLTDKYAFIDAEGLKGAFLYYEYKTNDGRLVIETLKKASELGAFCLNYAEPVKLLSEEGHVVGATVIDHKLNKEFDINAGMVVNATGVWCAQFLESFNTKLPKELYPTKGIHIAILKEKLPLSEAFYIETDDKRMIFVIPRQNHVYVGTTDTFFDKDYSEPEVFENEAEYLISCLNNNFKGLNIGIDDVVSCWAGIRPLLRDKSDKPGEISRRDELFLADNGLLTITGGKLTGYRQMAKAVVDNALVFLNKDHVACKTHEIRVSGSEWDNLLATDKLVEQGDIAFDEAKQTNITPQDFKVLFYRYGLNINIITEKAYELFNVEKDSAKAWLKAELWYALNYEMVTSLIDFFVFRTEMVLFEIERIEKHKHFVAEYMQEQLNWTNDDLNKELEKFENYWKLYKINK